MTSLRETVARDVCLAGGNTDGGCCYTDDCPQGCRMIGKERGLVADAALKAQLEYWIEHGPTEAMCWASYLNAGKQLPLADDENANRTLRIKATIRFKAMMRVALQEMKP